MPDFSHERAAGLGPIAGVDEAGRGPLAGPVVAAAVILDPAQAKGSEWARLDDSKKMTKAARDDLYAEIRRTASVGIAVVDVDEIDLLNILGATMKAMAEAVRALPVAPARALVDGNRPPALPCPATCLVGGDGASMSIAAASVVAKVTRDRIMAALDRTYPGYGWAQNAGYGTRQHLDALARLGATPVHRRSFAPVRKILSASTD